MKRRESRQPWRFRCLFQLSLRSFLILVTLASLWTAHMLRQSRQQQEAVAKVRELHGSIYLHWSRDYQVDAAGNIVGSPVAPGHPWLRRMLGDEYFDRVAWVDLSNRTVTDADLAELPKLRDLEGLNLDDTEVTTDGLVTISQMHWLRELAIGHQEMRMVVARNPVSVQPRTSRGPVKGNGRGVSELRRLRHLESLQLIEVPLPPDRLAFLAQMPKLECLNLWGCAVGDEDLRFVAQLSGLKRLNLSGTEVTDAGLVHVAKLAGLEELYLNGTAMSGGGTQELASLKKLKRLEVRYTGTSSADVAALQSLLPASCAVDWLPGNFSGLQRRSAASRLTELRLIGHDASARAMPAEMFIGPRYLRGNWGL